MATRDSSLNHHKFMQYSLPDLMSMANSRNTAAQGQPAQFDMTDLGLGPGTIQNGQLYFPKGSVTDNGNHARYITDNGQGGTGINDVQNSKGFLGDLAGFKGLEGKNFLKEIGSNPSRLLTGIDPFSTKLWNKALGTNNNALVDQMGGATPQRFKDAEAAGINTGAGRTTEGIAHAVASLYAGGALAGLAGGGAAAGAGVGEGAGTIGAHGAFTALDAAGLPAAAGVAPMGLAGALPNVAGGGLLAGGAGLGAAAAGGGASSGAALGAGGVSSAAGVAPAGAATAAAGGTGATGTAAGAGGLLSGDTLKSAIKLAPTALSALGAVKSLTGNSTSQQTATTQNKLDPRVDNIIFGNQQKQLKPGAVPTGEDANGRPIYKPEDYITTGNQGLLDRYQGFLDQKQTPGANLYGQTSDNFAGLNALKDMNAVRDSSYKLMNGNQAPQMTAAQSGAPSRMQAAQGMASQTELPNGYNVTNANHSMSDAASSNAASANAASMQAAHINAPGQNNLNLTDAYDKFINGESGNNPYLTGAIQKGINQSKTAFENMQTDATRNLTENVLGNIRSGALASGGYGGSRQANTENNAVKDFSTQMGRAASQFGQNNTDSAIAAQSGQYGQDQSNKLNALNNLSGQQYNVASQNASMQQQAGQANMGNQQQSNMFNAGNQQQSNLSNADKQQQMNMFNAGNQQQSNMFNANNANDASKTQYAGLLNTRMGNTSAQNQMGMANLNNNQNANQTNYNGDLNNSQFNTGLQQQANERNLGSNLSTNDMNSRNTVAGSGLLQGQMSNNYNTANGWGNYGLNNASQVNGLLTPYTTVNGSQTQSQPLYTNNNANALGWASLGMKAYDMYNGSSGGSVDRNAWGVSPGFG